MTLLTLDLFFVIAGLFVAALAGQIALDPTHPRRIGSAVFWGLLAVVMLVGGRIPPLAVGYALLVMVVLTAVGQVGLPRFVSPSESELEAHATRHGNGLLVPVLAVPAVAIVGGFGLDRVAWDGFTLVATKQLSQVALGLGCLTGLALAFRLTRERPATAVREGGRLVQLIGWALILPQLLAALGGVFKQAGVGEEVARLVALALPVENPFVAVVAYCAAMALFTMMMGNAFAAFPVITLGIGIPFIVKMHGGDPALMGAVGMLSGYCGTLVTPMAANFNLVPVRLLELKDDWAAIKAQAPFAAAIWVFNVVLMCLCVYRA